MQTSQISVRIDKDLKRLALQKSKLLGISLSGLYKMFLQNFVKNDDFIAFNFDEKIWNDYFCKQKKYFKVSEDDLLELQDARLDLKNKKVVFLKKDQSLQDLVKDN